MAKIIFYESPFDYTKKQVLLSSGTIRANLKYLKIEHDQLCVTINGETPDDVDIDSVLSSTDVVEIRRIVHGGNSGTKSTLATVIQLAALVASVAVPALAPYATAILIGGTVVSGIFSKWSRDLMGASGDDTAKADIATNNYSLSSVRNEARPMAPLILPMGSHRYGPDVHTDTMKGIALNQQETGPGAPYIESFIPGIRSDNGPASPNNNWATMPQGYLFSSSTTARFPLYELKIAPFGFGLPDRTLTSSENTALIEMVRDYWNSSSNPYLWFMQTGGTAYPLVVYHSDPADPFYGRYNLFNYVSAISRAIRDGVLTNGMASYSDSMGNLFSGTNFSNANIFFNRPVSGSSKNLITIIPGYYYPSAILSGDSNATMMFKSSAHLLVINNGSYTSTPKTESWPTQIQYINISVLEIIKEGIDYSNQTFNWGIGDLDISQRRIGAVDVEKNNGMLAKYSPINTGQYPFIDRWSIPELPITEIMRNMICPMDVYSLDDKQLKNVGAPTSSIPLTDDNQYNFIYFESQYEQDRFEFFVTGQLYRATSSGMSSNSTRIEIQWKMSNESSWRMLENMPMYIENNNTKKVNIGVMVQSELIFGEPLQKDNTLQVRVRKMTLDDSDNEEDRVCNLSLTKIRFSRSNFYSSVYQKFANNAPMNLEGLYISSLISDASQTNTYSGLVESKCWVYNFDTDQWVWTKTRNPAFWFLYYAYGGFLNASAERNLSYPYSPTYGWVNYPGHPDNTDHIFGVGLSNDEIDVDKILEWAFFCEQNNLSMDMVLKDDTSCSEVLDRIASCGRGSSSYYNGKLSVIYEDHDQPATCMFGMGNIISGSFSVDYNVSDPVRKIVGRYVDRETWESDQVEAIVPFSSPSNLKVVDIILEGITDRERAQREVNLNASRQFYQRRTYRWETDIEGYIARRGDVVYLSHDSTQYGFSGRAMRFNVNDGLVSGIDTGANIDEGVKYFSVRYPNGEMETFECSVVGKTIIPENYPIEKAPFYVNDMEENSLSDFEKSIAEDFIFIADVKETPGKRVRISEIESSDNGVFTLTAVDEDPSMWMNEYEGDLSDDSFKDSEVVLEIANASVEYLGGDKVKILWNMKTGDFAQVINLATGLPLESNGQYSFSRGEAVFELTEGSPYNLEIRPFSIGTPYKSISKEVSVWQE